MRGLRAADLGVRAFLTLTHLEGELVANGAPPFFDTLHGGWVGGGSLGLRALLVLRPQLGQE